MSPRALERLGLAGVLLLAAVLRLYRLGWGLPEFHFPDEATVFHVALQIATTRDLHTGSVSYPPLTMIVLAAVYATRALLGGEPVAALTVPQLVWWGRLVMAVCSVATVAATAALGRALYGSRVALVAGLFLAVTPLHVTQSHVVCTDVPLTLLVVLALLATPGNEAPRWPCSAASGLFAGLAAASKYPGALVGLAAGCDGMRGLARALWRGERRGARRWVVALAAATIAVLAGFTLGFPHWVQDLHAVQQRLLFENYANRERGIAVARLGREGVRGTRGLYQLAILLPFALGPPLWALALAGVARTAWRPGRREFAMLAFAVPYFVFFATAHSIFPRYFLPLLPVLAVAAARVAVRTGAPGTWRRSAVAALGMIAALYAAALSASLVAHTGLAPQHALRAAVERALAEGRFPMPPVVAHSQFMFDWTGVRLALDGLPVQQVQLALDHDWLRAHRPELVVVSEMDEIVATRNYPESEEAATVRALAAGALPYELIADIRVSYFQRGLYGWLDPYFRVSYERGQVGFRLYASSEGNQSRRRRAASSAPA